MWNLTRGSRSPGLGLEVHSVALPPVLALLSGLLRCGKSILMPQPLWTPSHLLTMVCSNVSSNCELRGNFSGLTAPVIVMRGTKTGHPQDVLRFLPCPHCRPGNAFAWGLSPLYPCLPIVQAYVEAEKASDSLALDYQTFLIPSHQTVGSLAVLEHRLVSPFCKGSHRKPR